MTFFYRAEVKKDLNGHTYLVSGLVSTDFGALSESEKASHLDKLIKDDINSRYDPAPSAILLTEVQAVA